MGVILQRHSILCFLYIGRILGFSGCLAFEPKMLILFTYEE